MRLLLIRHGQTPSNVVGALDTDLPGAPLTELGLQQARAIPEALRDERIDAIYSSAALRAQMTAAPLAEALGLEVTVRDDLKEVSAGSLEMLSDEASRQAYLDTVFAWGRGDTDVSMPGGYDGHTFLRRIDGAIGEIARERHDTVVIVAHGAVIRQWAAIRSQNLDSEWGTHHPLRNTAMVILTGDPEAGWSAERWGSHPVGGAELGDPAAEDPTGDPE